MIKKYTNLDQFKEEHLHYIRQDEITNNFALSVLFHKRKKQAECYTYLKDDIFLYAIYSRGRLILLSNSVEKYLVNQMVKEVKNLDFQEVLGPTKLCYLFQELYETQTNRKLEITMYQSNYYCKNVLVPKSVGRMRVSTMSDFDVLRFWAYDFEKFLGYPVDKNQLNQMLERRIVSGNLFVLTVDNYPVSMASISDSLGQSITISYVYTPVDFRKKGYASKLVALIADNILSKGKYATLYTDDLNPTSNKIYKSIGFTHFSSCVLLKKLKRSE